MQKHIIVHIDDDLDDLEVIGDELKKHDDVEIIQFTDAEKGLKSVVNLIKFGIHPVLILLDADLPGMNGKDALVQLRNHPILKNIPVTLFSTSTTLMDVKFAEKYNASFLTKPVDMSTLREKPNKLISNLNA